VSSAKAKDAMFETLARLLPDLAGSKGASPLTKPGLRVHFYAPNPSNVARETLTAMTPASTGTAATIVMDQPVLKTRDAFALMFTGHLLIEKAGAYTFFISSDDGSRFYIDGELLINNDGLHGMVEKRGTVNLTAGLHPITATYFDNGGGDGLRMSWSGPDIDKQEIPAAVLVSAAEQTVQDLGIMAMMQIPGHEAKKVAVLAGLLTDRASIGTTLQALTEVTADNWPKDQLSRLQAGSLAFLQSLPPKERNSAHAELALRISSATCRR
jgi:hypothetical protein